MPDFLVYPIAFLVLLGIMVVVHEFGHFAVAKLCKVRVEAFSVGFGPRLFGIKYGETDYKLCALPLGGYVKMAGELPGEDPVLDDPGAFNAHPRWQRMLIGFAGPAANFVLAFVLMAFYFSWINEVPNIKTVKLEWVSQGSTAAQAGLQPGDIIRQFDGLNNPDWYAVMVPAADAPSRDVSIAVERNGKLIPTSLRLPEGSKGKPYDLSTTGLFIEEEQAPIGVKEVIADSPAEKAGLRAGDSILSVDGHAFHTLEPMVDYLQAGRGKPITLTVAHPGAAAAQILVQPTEQDGKWMIGFGHSDYADLPTRDQPMGFVNGVSESAVSCMDSSKLIFGTIQKLLTRQASVKQLMGPLGIAQAAGDAAKTKGWSTKFDLAASISLNLGILNLMPFPILDGGLILFLLIESIMRHDVNILVKERIYQAAFVVLVFFAIFIIFNDATRMPFFAHLKL